MLNNGLFSGGVGGCTLRGRVRWRCWIFFNSCFDHEAGVVREIGCWEAGWEERVRRIVPVSHAEKRDGVVVRLSCYCNAV